MEYYTHNDVTSSPFGVSYIPAAKFLPEKHILEPLTLDKKMKWDAIIFNVPRLLLYKTLLVR